jgi:hypothetical protein
LTAKVAQQEQEISREYLFHFFLKSQSLKNPKKIILTKNRIESGGGQTPYSKKREESGQRGSDEHHFHSVRLILFFQ